LSAHLPDENVDGLGQTNQASFCPKLMKRGLAPRCENDYEFLSRDYNI
jgi:hypothetical protein